MMQKIALAVCVATLLSAPVPRTRAFSFEYAATVENIPQGARQVDLWIPVPDDSPYQTITGLRVHSPLPYTILRGSDGNRVLHLREVHPAQHTLTVAIDFDAVRREHAVSWAATGPDPAPPAGLARWLRPSRLVPDNPQIRAWAEQVVTQAHAQTDIQKARAIYNYILATMKYDKTGEGWGRGDIYYACSRRHGNCSDFHAVFIGFCHALGIPAKFEIGFPLPDRRGAGAISGYHCWAEFYAKGIGWIPVDASEASKHPDKRNYFFGHHDENRVQFSRGRDVNLAPRQAGQPLNFFIYPYAEIDGQPYANTAYTVHYRDLPFALAARN
jgi:transglutaminase-like putative cysteine protease